MPIISFSIFTILSATALLHMAWAFGLNWPAKTEQDLVNMVVGAKGMRRMPSLTLTTAVSVGMVAAGLFALWGTGNIILPLPEWVRIAALATLTAIFLIRGIASYVPLGPLQASVEPFQTLNRKYFSPLILAIGIGYLAILLSLLNT